MSSTPASLYQKDFECCQHTGVTTPATEPCAGAATPAASRLRAGRPTIPSPTGSDCGSRMHLIVLVRPQRGAGGCNASFDPIQKETIWKSEKSFPKVWATRTRPPGANARVCLSMGVWVNNPTRGVPATVQRVTSCRLLRPLRDGRVARENWRDWARGTQVPSLAG